MSGIQPYKAWLFGLADDRDEVNREMHEATHSDPDGFIVPPTDISRVTVMGVEHDHFDYVWVIYDDGPNVGQIDRLESWRVRRKPD